MENFARIFPSPPQRCIRMLMFQRALVGLAIRDALGCAGGIFVDGLLVSGGYNSCDIMRKFTA